MLYPHNSPGNKLLQKFWINRAKRALENHKLKNFISLKVSDDALV